MRDPQFSALIGPARLYPELWRLLLGLLVILFCAFGAIAILLVVAYPVVGPLEYFGWVLNLARPATPGAVVAVLLSFAGMFLGPILAAGACHLRGAGTLFGPRDETLRSFGLTVALLLPIYGLMIGVNWLIDPPLPGLPVMAWLKWLPLALPLVLLQTTSEELIFRGYLQQQLAARFFAKWVWMGIPSVVFAALHYNPEAGMNTWLILITTFAFALIAADLTEKTGSLGAAMGLHFVNNVFAMLVLAVQDTITGLALYVTPYTVADSTHLPIGIGLDLILLFAIWRLLRAVVTR